MQYRILVDTNALSLSKQIEASLEAGWDLHGSVALTALGNSIVFAQAITTDEDAPLPPRVDKRDLAEILKEAVRGIDPPS